jgi:hypothetical protein
VDAINDIVLYIFFGFVIGGTHLYCASQIREQCEMLFVCASPIKFRLRIYLFPLGVSLRLFHIVS